LLPLPPAAFLDMRPCGCVILGLVLSLRSVIFESILLLRWRSEAFTEREKEAEKGEEEERAFFSFSMLRERNEFCSRARRI